MTEGQKYIKDNFIEELEYEEAINQAIKELQSMGIIDSETFDNMDPAEYHDNPVYPANAQLYDDFVDDQGFYLEDFIGFCIRRMEND